MDAADRVDGVDAPLRRDRGAKREVGHAVVDQLVGLASAQQRVVEGRGRTLTPTTLAGADSRYATQR